MNESLTIIIPAYNESQRIVSYLSKIDSYTSKNKNINVLVINDGSTDNTDKIVTDWIKEKSTNKSHFEIISHFPNRGKGFAVCEGFKKAKGDLILYTDADGASPIEEVEKLLYWMNNGADVVCGSRVLKSEGTKVEMSFKRRFTGLIFHLILRLCGLANLRDTQCGFKIFKKEVAKNLVTLQQCFNYSFDIEYLFLANKLGYKIKEIPVNWYHVEGSKVNLVKDSIKMLIEVLKIRFVYKYN